jgi:hypothetical protein
MTSGWQKMAMVLALASLGGCAARTGPQDGSSSAQGPQDTRTAWGDKQGPIYMVAQYDVENIAVTVPRDLVVSEANTYRPNADIVWRGEPIGDRYAQVATIVTEAMSLGTAMMTSGRKVDIEITIARFHCVTERTRYSIGGLHGLQFDLTVRDAATGIILDGPRRVVANTKASGGAKAIAEDTAGLTQRVVVRNRLAEAIRFELSRPVPRSEGEALAMLAAMRSAQTAMPPN